MLVGTSFPDDDIILDSDGETDDLIFADDEGKEADRLIAMAVAVIARRLNRRPRGYFVCDHLEWDQHVQQLQQEGPFAFGQMYQMSLKPFAFGQMYQMLISYGHSCYKMRRWQG